MAKIARFNGDVRAFGSTATGTDRTIFGDTAQSDLLDDNLTANFLTGWGILAAGAKPPKEYFNGALYTATQFIAYLHEEGIAEWNTSQKYYIGSLSRGSDNIVYSSVTGTDPSPNTGTDPSSVTDGSVWKIASNPYAGEFTTHNITVDADYTLTSLQNKYGKVVITDTGVVLTTERNIIVDNVQKPIIIKNSTAQTLTVKTSAGTGISILTGRTVWLYCDGTNVITITDLAQVVSTIDSQAGINNANSMTALRLHQTMLGSDSQQAWADVTGSRSSGVTYTNTTGRPIFVHIHSASIATTGTLSVVVDGVTIDSLSMNAGSRLLSSFIVPNGKTYVATITGTTFSIWSELR